MYRWATFFLFVLFLLLPYRSVAATTDTFSTRPAQRAGNAFTGVPAPALPIAVLPTTVVSELVQAADLIVRGQVTAIHSFWNADHSLIESDVTIAVTYKLLGQPPPTLTIRTPGGFLTEDGLGMVSIHAAEFAVGEELLLFAYRQGDTWQMVGGATGKFLLQQQMALNPDLALAQPLAGLLPAIVELISKRGLQTQVPVPWRYVKNATPTAPTIVAAPQNDKRRWRTPHATAPFVINLNTNQLDNDNGSRADFRQAIIAAAASWSQVPDVDFALTYVGETNVTQTGYNGVNEVLFMHKGQQERAAAAQVWYTADGTIIEADIWINEDYAWNATGRPAATEVDLQSALLHEFGHWLILGHCADHQAVMFAKLTTGTLKRALQLSDLQGIRAIYPQNH